METRRDRGEAERWIDVARKLLEARDLLGSQRFARKARETDPTVDGIDQITAIVDVLLAAEKRINNHLDWYAILQLDRRSNDLELIKRQYRKLALLLHPDKNKSPFSDNAFKLVCDAWAFLSDSSKKTLYDNEFNMFLKYDPVVLNNQQMRRSGRGKRKTAAADTDIDGEEVVVQKPVYSQSRLSTFWTVCPYCFHLYEYPRVYEDCCLRCQKCRRSFHAVVIPAPPQAIGPGKEMYYCCWAIFPIGYTTPENLAQNPNWTPFKSMFPEKGSGNDLHEDDDRGGKKGTTGSVNNNGGSAENFQGVTVNVNVNVNVPDKGVQNGSIGNNVDPQKRLRTKTTARKAVLISPKPYNKLVVEGPDKINGTKSNSDRAGMDLNVNMANNSVEDGSGANNVEPQKILRTKTTARKSVAPKPNNKPITEASDEINGGKSDSERVGMDLDVNMPNKGEQVAPVANTVKPQKTLKTKTTARKSIAPKPNNKPIVEVPGETNRGELDSKQGGMDLNLGVKPEAEQPRVTDTLEGLGIDSLYSEATEGSGFFEGLDDILGNLPMLAVPGDQKAQTSS